MPAGYGKGGYDGSGTQGGMDSGMGVSPGEGPSNDNNVFSKIGNFVKGIVSGTPQKNQRTVPSSQNFNQLTSSQKANLAQKGYTISKSGNTVYSRTTPSAREKVENQFAGIDPNVAFRGAVAGINPETGMMWSGGTKGGALDQFTKSMMTPQRAEQNRSRASKYADRSARVAGGDRTRSKGVFGFLDLDKDGGIFTSTGDDGTVYGMSNKAIYDPSLPTGYKGIPGTYAAKTGGAFPQKTSEDRMLANQVMSYVMPGAGIARLGNYVRGKLAPKTEAVNQTNSNNLVSGPGNLTDAQILSNQNNQYMVPSYLMPPEIIGYRPDGTPVGESDLDAAQYRGVGM
jgi:hypothetical protein